MKRFIVFANSMNTRLGKESTFNGALALLKKRNNGVGNIVELNDLGEWYKTYGISKRYGKQVVECWRKII